METPVAPAPAPLPDEPKKTNTWLIVAIVAVVLCCCCVIVLGLLYKFGDCITSPNDPNLCPFAMNLIGSLLL